MESVVIVRNQQVLARIKELLRDEFVCYGYEKITCQLGDEGFLINAKKVYRIMKEAQDEKAALRAQIREMEERGELDL